MYTLVRAGRTLWGAFQTGAFRNGASWSASLLRTPNRQNKQRGPAATRWGLLGVPRDLLALMLLGRRCHVAILSQCRVQQRSEQGQELLDQTPPYSAAQWSASVLFAFRLLPVRRAASGQDAVAVSSRLSNNGYTYTVSSCTMYMHTLCTAHYTHVGTN